MMDFQITDFSISTFTTNGFIQAVYRLTTTKINFHHSHVTQKNHGNAKDFCNQKVRENQDFFLCLAHNIFGFDFYFIMKGTRLPVWKSKDIQVGGPNLTNIIFANLGSQTKLVVTLKHYQQSLDTPSSTATVELLKRKPW